MMVTLTLHDSRANRDSVHDCETWADALKRLSDLLQYRDDVARILHTDKIKVTIKEK